MTNLISTTAGITTLCITLGVMVLILICFILIFRRKRTAEALVAALLLPISGGLAFLLANSAATLVISGGVSFFGWDLNKVKALLLDLLLDLGAGTSFTGIMVSRTAENLVRFALVPAVFFLASLILVPVALLICAAIFRRRRKDAAPASGKLSLLIGGLCGLAFCGMLVLPVAHIAAGDPLVTAAAVWSLDYAEDNEPNIGAVPALLDAAYDSELIHGTDEQKTILFSKLITGALSAQQSPVLSGLAQSIQYTQRDVLTRDVQTIVTLYERLEAMNIPLDGSGEDILSALGGMSADDIIEVTGLIITLDCADAVSRAIFGALIGVLIGDWAYEYPQYISIRGNEIYLPLTVAMVAVISDSFFNEATPDPNLIGALVKNPLVPLEVVAQLRKAVF